MINTQGRNRIFSLFITVAVSARRKEIKMCFFLKMQSLLLPMKILAVELLGKSWRVVLKKKSIFGHLYIIELFMFPIWRTCYSQGSLIGCCDDTHAYYGRA